ncbi:MAG: 50S ribosomal protein L29 [bacterium]|nr:50S ribosomal protein L29 [bacterium]
MKSANIVKDLRALTPKELKQREVKVSEDLMKLRFSKKTGQLKQSHRLGDLRRELARIKTVLNEARAQ